MRWLFYNPNDPEEATRHRALLEQIDGWWETFAASVDQLDAHFSRRSQWDLPCWMEEHLQCIDPNLMWEFGPAVNCDGHRLVITPESEKTLRPLVAAIIQSAPKIEGWEFYPYRLPESVEAAFQAVEVRTAGDLTEVEAQVTLGEDHRIDIVYRSPTTSGDENQQALNDAFVATETLLGEEILDKWVGAIEAGPMPAAGLLGGILKRGQKRAPHLIPLGRLQETVDALINSIRDQLPPRAYFEWVQSAEWTLFKLEPEKAVDYPEQTDLFVGKSANTPLWIAAHRGSPFYSERFSRCGETFCYVKLDGSDGLDEEQFADKAEIEDALDAALTPEGIGCHIGGGTGLRYSYIDLALTDLERGIDIVRQRLRQGNVPRRSWIQFFDADLTAEWIGIYDDSPPPPGFEFNP